jgi:hypothetical protein
MRLAHLRFIVFRSFDWLLLCDVLWKFIPGAFEQIQVNFYWTDLINESFYFGEATSGKFARIWKAT